MVVLQRFTIGLLCILLLAGIFSPVQAQQGRDPAFEAEILARLNAINSLAVPFFEQGTRAFDAEDYEAAKTGFSKTLELAPDFPDALRRLSQAEVRLDLLDEALVHAEKALEIDPSAYNKVNLADILSHTDIPADYARAHSLAKEAFEELPEDIYANDVLMITAVTQRDLQALRTTSLNLIRMLPEYPVAHFYYAITLADDGKFERAEAEMLKARDLGMPTELINQMLTESGLARQARIYRTARWTAYLVAGWLVGMLILFVSGMGLNRMTLAAVRKAEVSSQTKPTRSESRVRTIYRAVIGLTSVYFYISIPFIILLVVAIGGGIIFFFFAVGTIPTQLVFIIGVSVLFTLYAVIRSIFTRFKQTEPGRPLDREEAPALYQLAEDIASQLQTQPIQAIYLTPGTDIAVFEQGTMLQKTRGRGKRVLLLGLGILPGMTQGQLKSILAHEYGHFIRKDTAGGDIAYQVQRSMNMMAFGLARSGQARWYNPAWLFLIGYYRVFLRITLGASRLQEILADRYAAIAYGARNFIDGLSHVIRQSITFQFQLKHKIEQAVENKILLTNLYSTPVLSTEQNDEQIDKAIDEAFNKPSDTYDSHPSPAERFRLVKALDLAQTEIDPDEDQPAWDLFRNASELQEEITAKVNENLGKQFDLSAPQVEVNTALPES